MKLVPKQYTLREAFGPEYPDAIVAQGYEKGASPFQPKGDAGWVWEREILRDLMIWWKDGGNDPLYLFGPTGAGKSSAIVNFAAALGIPLYEKTIYAGVEFPELVVDKDLVGGDTINSFGVLPMAMGVTGNPGILLLNEVDRAEEGGFLTGLYEVLQGRPLTLNNAGVDVIQPEAGFRVVATGNTAMMGDHSGLHAGARQQDIAFMDRFWKVRAAYPKVETEKRILEKAAPTLPEAIRERLIAAANEVRAMYMGENGDADAIPLTFSTRSLVRWAVSILSFGGAERDGQNPVYLALDRAMLYAADGMPEVRAAVLKLVHGKLGGDAPAGMPGND